MARSRTAALLLAALAASALLAGAAAQAQTEGKGAKTVSLDPKVAAAAAAAHKNATVASLLGQWAKAGAGLNNKTAALRSQLNQRVHSALDKAAVVLNGAAGAAGQVKNGPAGHVNATAQSLLAGKGALVRQGVAAAAGQVAKATAKAEQRIMPLRNQVANATAGLKKELSEATANTFKTAMAAQQYISQAQTNITAPFKKNFAPQQEQANALITALLRWEVERMVEAGETAASATNTLDQKFGTFEQFLHNFTDPVDKAAKDKRDLAKESVSNVTRPIFDLMIKMFPELTPPTLSQLFGGIFGNLPPPPEYNPYKDPQRDYDPVWPSADKATNPTGEPNGHCVPWSVPAGYRHVNDFCRDMQNKPMEYFAEMFNRSAPARGTPFPLSGCVVGCIVGNDSFTQTQKGFSEGFGWSGKCFSEDKTEDGVPRRFASTLNRNYQAYSGFTQQQRIVPFTGVGPFIFGGSGGFTERSLYDGKPTFTYTDDRPSPGMFTAGGWRTLYTLFQMVADGVTDEMRVVQPGWVIGKSFYARQQGIVPDKWRTPRDTNFFMLFQSCTGDGRIPWRPEQRELPVIGDN